MTKYGVILRNIEKMTKCGLLWKKGLWGTRKMAKCWEFKGCDLRNTKRKMEVVEVRRKGNVLTSPHEEKFKII